MHSLLYEVFVDFKVNIDSAPRALFMLTVAKIGVSMNVPNFYIGEQDNLPRT